MLTYPDATQWLIIMNVKIDMVDPNTAPDTNGVRPVIKRLTTKTHVFNENLQKQRIAENKLQKRLKHQEWDTIIADKKALMTLIYGQYNKATLNEFSLRRMYKADCNAGNLVSFLD